MGEPICKECLAWAMNAPEDDAECVLCKKDAEIERLEAENTRLRESIAEHAIKIATDYPGISNAPALEQLYAIAASYEGTCLANTDCHAEIKRMKDELHKCVRSLTRWEAN